jgi:small subunit ribosomal protein S6
MNKYEAMVLYSPELKDSEVKKKIQELKDKINEFKGEIIEEDYWGIKELAYTVNKYSQGYYSVILFNMQQDQINKLSMWLNQNEENILRNLITRI